MPTRAKTDTTEMREDLMRDLKTLREHCVTQGNPDLLDTLAGVETFCAVALRVFAKTNPSKIRSEAVTTEISAYQRVISEKEGMTRG